ncbi:hypothetical protein J7E63_15815 [Bacillus sp. ISL-75]|uniref:hypothetical protein n=1 Tax=Bacillus sp. ISL-75 TaxID=2819137 RepID=UPI001BE6A229|nr:hypothetical protein [Bacillus sp. ISL-75]MBT2728396.1 hypothetical protein [Bacillus sp. ISL-75]
MNLVELKNILEATGYPVAYSHFVESENYPIPAPPFICYLTVYTSNFSADNSMYFPMQNVQIELYTDQKDLEAESLVENVLNENEIPFASSEAFIEEENLFQKIYEVRLF